MTDIFRQANTGSHHRFLLREIPSPEEGLQMEQRSKKGERRAAADTAEETLGASVSPTHRHQGLAPTSITQTRKYSQQNTAPTLRLPSQTSPLLHKAHVLGQWSEHSLVHKANFNRWTPFHLELICLAVNKNKCNHTRIF